MGINTVVEALETGKRRSGVSVNSAENAAKFIFTFSASFTMGTRTPTTRLTDRGLGDGTRSNIRELTAGGTSGYHVVAEWPTDPTDPPSYPPIDPTNPPAYPDPDSPTDPDDPAAA